MPISNDSSPESFDESTLPTPKDAPSSHQVDQFATAMPEENADVPRKSYVDDPYATDVFAGGQSVWFSDGVPNSHR
jgi:hypothetical protein